MDFTQKEINEAQTVFIRVRRDPRECEITAIKRMAFEIRRIKKEANDSFIKARLTVECRSMESAPWNTEVLLMGKTGYIEPHDKFIINGYRVNGWHQNEWNDASGTRLSDNGWIPTSWQPIQEETN